MGVGAWWERGLCGGSHEGFAEMVVCFRCRCSCDASSAFGVLSMIPAPLFSSLSKVLHPFLLWVIEEASCLMKLRFCIIFLGLFGVCVF